MFKRAICLAGVVIAATLSGSHAQAGDALSNQEILRLAPGTFQALVKGKYAVTVTLARDGSAVGRAQGLEDRGRWTVRGDELCIVLPTWTRGRVECSAVVADNGWYRGRNVAFRKL
ncbi:MAG TPA: hypothetical protein P5337_14305 [Aestuariivirga sp.]|nr:hypothetical protein [Alphaproteobacteria bacterium]HRX37560.1 hypothetical protein [Aestuariivirga sp.]